MAPPPARKPRILACAIYSRLNTARNDFLHGNRVSDAQLVNMPFRRFMPDYAPVLYRMALTSFLDLRFAEKKPDDSNEAGCSDWRSRKFHYEKYQRDMEVALGTFNLTIEEHRRRRGITGKLALF